MFALYCNDVKIGLASPLQISTLNMRKSVLTSFAALVLSVVAMYTARAATYYVANSGDDIRPPAIARNIATPWQTIAFAISQSVDGDIIVVAPGSYPENLSITKSITLTGGGVSKPVLLGGTGGGNAVISVSVPNVTVNGFVIEVDQANNLYGIISNSTNIDGLRITGNTILSTAVSGNALCLQFPTMGIFLQGIGTSSYTISRNIVYPKNPATTCVFGRSVRVVGGRGTIGGPTLADSNLFGSYYSVQLAAPAGPVTISNNHLFGIGVHIVDPLANSGTHNVTNNRLEPGVPGSVPQLIEVRGVTRANSAVNVTGNTLSNYNYIGVLSARSNNVTVANNSFTPRDTSSFAHIMVNSKQETAGSAASQTPFTNGIVVTGNTFRSAPSYPNTGIGVWFADHNNIAGPATFAPITIGGAGALANTFNIGIKNYIALDTASGPSILNPLYPDETPITSTTMSPAKVAVNAMSNNFGVSGGTMMPSAMSIAQLFQLEDHIQHAVDLSSLGFVTVTSGTAYVTPSSFVAPRSMAGSIQRGVDNVALNGTVLVNAGTYTENVNVNRSVTVSSTSLGRPVVNGDADSAVFLVSAPNVTITGFRIHVSQATTLYGVLASSNNVNGVIITDNIILSVAQARNCSRFNTVGIWLRNIGTNRYTITRNVVSALTTDGNTCIFGRGFRANGGFGTVGGAAIADSNMFLAVYSTQIVGASGGAVVIENNHMYFQGMHFNAPAANSGNHIVRGNRFDAAFPQFVASLIEIRNVFATGTSLAVSNNVFNNFAYNGVFSTRSNAVTVRGNTFNPYDTTSFIAVNVNTKQGTNGPATSETALVNSINITSNNFNAATTANGGIAIGFYNHNNLCTFANVVVGASGQENSFASRLGAYVYQDTAAGFSGQLAQWSGENPTSITNVSPAVVNADIRNNRVDGLAITSMNDSQRYNFSDKVWDAIDWSSLGYLSFDNNTAYVSNNAFIGPKTTSASLGRAVAVLAEAGNVKFTGASFLSDNITFTKAVTLSPTANHATTVGSFITNAAGKTITLDGPFSIATAVNTSAGGIIDPKTYDLTLLPSATMAAGAANGYVLATSGKVIKQGAANGVTNFAVGTATGYYPLSINDANNTNDTWSVLLAGRSSPGSFVPPLFPSAEQFVNVQWLLTEGTIGGSSATVTLGWPSASVLGGALTATQSYVANLSGTGWTQTAAASAPTGTATAPTTEFRSFAVYGEKMLSGNVYYLADTGLDTRTNVQAQDPTSPWRTFNKAVASVADGDTIIVISGTFPENVNINKQIAIIGNPANKVNKPVVNGTSGQAVFTVNARNVTIQNLTIEVEQVNTIYGIFTDAGGNGYNNLRVLDNNILSTFPGPSAGKPIVWLTWAVYLGGQGTSGVTVQRNHIARKDPSRLGFGRGVRMIGGWGYIGGVSKADSNSIYALYSVQAGDVKGGPLYVLNNKLNYTVEINSPATNSGGVVVRGNVVNFPAVIDSAVAGIEVKNATNPNAPVVIDSNVVSNFHNFGILAGHSRFVTISNNTLNPFSAVRPRSIGINTKQQTVGQDGPISVDATIIGNTINGAVTSNSVGIEIANHDNTSSLGNIIIGGTGSNANRFVGGFNRFVSLDTFSLSSNQHYLWRGGPDNQLAVTLTSPAKVNVDLTNNVFTVAGGLKAPSAMTLTELYEVESKLLHKTHYDSLGFLTVVPNTAYVGNSSFILPYTSVSSVQRGINGVNTYSGATATVLTESASYPESIIGRNVTLQSAFTPSLTLNGITVSNPADTLTLGSRIELTNLLALQGGIVDANTNQLALRSTVTVADGSTNSYVATNTNTGGLVHLTVGNTLRRFPIGAYGLGYTPVTFTDANNSGDSILARVRPANTTGAFAGGLPVGVTKYIGAEWDLKEGVSGGSNATLTFGWPLSAALGGPITTAGAVIGHYTALAWEERVATLGTASASAAGFTSFSPYAVYDNVLTGGKTYYVDSLIGDNGRANLTATNPNTPWKTITNAINRAVDRDTIVVRTDGTYGYRENIIVNKQLTLIGNDSNRTVKPVINGITTTSVVTVSSPNVTIDNFEIRVDYSKSVDRGIDAINGDVNNLTIVNNRLVSDNTLRTPTDLTFFRTWAIYIDGTSNRENWTIARNVITARSNQARIFGRGIRTFGGYGTIGGTTPADSNHVNALFALQLADISGGNTRIMNNHLFLQGLEINTPNTGTHIVRNNRFDASSPNDALTLIELKSNDVATASVLIDSNSFNGYVNYGVFSTRSNNVTVTANTFTPADTARNFTHIHVNSKQRTTSIAQPAFTNGITVTNNTFNGSTVGGGTGIMFGDADNFGGATTWGTLTVGGPSAPNRFAGSLRKFVTLDATSGNTSSIYPWNIATTNTLAVTVAGPTDANVNIADNLYTVAGGLKSPSTMSRAELFEVESKLQHTTAFSPLGLLTVTPGTLYVSNSSFVSPLTTVASLQRGVEAASANNTILIQPTSLVETVTVDKSLTFEAETASNQVVLTGLNMNAAGGNLTLASPFRLTNSLAFGINGGKVLIGNNPLNLAATATIAGGDANSYVVTSGSGVLTHASLPAATVTFPIGTSNFYAPVTVADANASGDSVAFGVAAAPLAGSFNPVLPGNANRFPGLQWTIGEGNRGTNNASLTFGWVPAALVNGPLTTNTVLATASGLTWNPLSVTIGTNSGTSTGFSSLGNTYAIYSTDQLSGIKYYVDSLIGDNARANVIATNPNTPWKTITNAINRTVDGDTIVVRTDGTYGYRENIIVNKQLTLIGNDSNRTVKPVINGITTTSVVTVSARNVTIDNFEIRVDYSRDVDRGIDAVNGDVNNLTIINNRLVSDNTLRTPADLTFFRTWAIYIDGTSNRENWTIARNVITTRSNQARIFGRGIRTFGGYGTIGGATPADSNHVYALFALQMANFDGGSTNIRNNHLFLQGLEINTPITGAHVVRNNRFDAGSPNDALTQIELKSNVEATASVLIDSNSFNGYVNYGVFSTRSNNVTVTANTFTPADTARNFTHIHVNSKQRTTALGEPAFTNGIVVTNNVFNGSTVGGGTGILFGDHDITGGATTWGTLTVGGPGAANRFAGSLQKFVTLDHTSGNTISIYPWNIATTNVLGRTTAGPTDANVNIADNLYTVAGGLKSPSIMSRAELFELESKLQHTTAFSPLGLLTVTPGTIYVSNSSFVSPLTTVASLQRGVDGASANNTVLIQPVTIAENVSVDKSLTFEAEAASNEVTVSGLTMNATGGNLSLASPFKLTTALVLNNGNITLGGNNLTLTSAATSGNGGAGSYVRTNAAGRFVKQGVNNTAVTFPVGTSNSYNPVTITDANSTADTLGVLVREGRSAATFTTALPAAATAFVNVEYDINERVVGGNAPTFNFGWNPGVNEVNPPMNVNTRILNLDGGNWVRYASTYNAVNATSANAGAQISNFGQFAVVRDDTPFALATEVVGIRGGVVTALCPGDSLKVVAQTTDLFNAPNVFTAQLSDATGSFATPTVLGSITRTSRDTIRTIIPLTALAGTGYRIRIVSSDAAFTGTDNGDNLTINPIPTKPVVTSTGTSYCVGDSLQLTAPTGFTSYVWSNGKVTQSIFVKTPGSFTVVVSNGACPSAPSDPIVVTENAKPNAAYVGLTSVVCQGTAVQNLIPTTPGGTFFVNGTAITGTTFDPTTVGSFVVRYSLTVNGCTDTTSQVITVNALPSAAFTGLPVTTCVSTTAIPLTPTVTGGTFSGTGVVGNTFVPSTPGTFNVVYTVVVNGCSNTTTSTVVVNALPNATYTGLAASYCAGAPVVTLTPTVTGGTFFVNGTAIAGTTFDPTTAGSFVVRYSVTSNGCTDTTSQVVTVNALPSAAFTGLPASTCVSTTAIPLTATVNGGTFSGTGVVGNTFVPSTPGSFNVVYTITVNGCINTSTSTVVVNAIPDATFTGLAANYCAGAASVTLTPTVAGGVFSGTGVTGNSFNPSTAGTFAITYTITVNGCSASTTTNVTVNPLPVATFTGLPATLCLGAAPVTLTPTVAGGVFSGTGVTGTSFSPTTVGTFTVTYTITVNGCQATSTGSVTVSPLPVATFTASNNAVCAGQTVTLTPTTAGGTFFVNGVAQAGASIVFANAGTFRVRYSVTNAGCTDTTGQNVLVNAKPNSAFTSDAAICAGQQLTITPGTTGGVFYVNGVATALPITAPTTAGTISVKYVLTNTSGCKDSTTNTVVVNALPDASFTAPTAGCINIPLTFVAATTGGTFTVNGAPITGSTYTPTVSGTLSVIYTVSQNGCTATSAPVSIDVNAGNLTVSVTYSGVQNFKGDTVIALEGDAVTFLAAGNPGTGTYTWTGNGVNQQGAELTVNATDDQIFTVTYNVGGCTVTRTVTLVINRQVYIPNFISPNGGNNDVKNRKLSIFGYGISTADFSFSVFNRYGGLVYSTTNPVDVTYPNGWDASNVPTDSYNYVIKGKLVNGTELKVEGRNTGSVYVQK